MKLRLIVFLTVTMIQCQSQNIVDLAKLSFNEQASVLLKGKGEIYKDRDYMSSLYCLYTFDVQNFKYDSHVFTKGGERGPDDDNASKVSCLVRDTISEKIEGIIISIQKSQETLKMLEEIKKKFGPPKILSPVPKRDKDGSILGTASYLWKNATTQTSILIAVSYGEKDYKSSIDAVIYIIDNSAKVLEEGNNFTVIDRIIKSHTP